MLDYKPNTMFVIVGIALIIAIIIDLIIYRKNKYTKTNLERLCIKLAYFLENQNVCDSHGLRHMIRVMILCKFACEADLNLNERQKHLICCAGLLHDVDDKKLFPDSINYANLRRLMKSYPKKDVDLVVEMVSYVSSSENGDTIPKNAIENPWLLYPRHADRIEAIGKVGMIRCYQYNNKPGYKLFTAETKRALNKDDLWNNIATVERYNSYKGNSASMIDHFYDKMLRAGMFQTENTFLDDKRKDKLEPMVEFILKFGTTGKIDLDMLKD